MKGSMFYKTCTCVRTMYIYTRKMNQNMNTYVKLLAFLSYVKGNLRLLIFLQNNYFSPIISSVDGLTSLICNFCLEPDNLFQFVEA